MEAQTHAPETSEEQKPRTASPPSARCPNCGTTLRGRFCHDCGQEQREPVQPLVAMVRDGLGTFLSLDLRIISTLRRLLFAPGRLTEAYLKGRRARFTKPLRLYLATSAVYFLVTQLTLPDFASVFFGGAIRVQGEAAANYQKWLPRLMFMLVPAFALLVELVQLRLRRFYVAHLIFSLHYFSFYFVLSLFLTLFRAGILVFGLGDVAWLSMALGVLFLLFATVAPVAYLALSTRRVYGDSAAWAGAKAVGLFVGQFVLLIAAAVTIDEAGLI